MVAEKCESARSFRMVVWDTTKGGRGVEPTKPSSTTWGAGWDSRKGKGVAGLGFIIGVQLLQLHGAGTEI